MDTSLLLFLIAVLVVAILLYVMISITKKTNNKLDKERYQVDMLHIEGSIEQGNNASYSMAIINADKLLDRALQDLRIPGRTMGDRLKKIGNMKRLSQLNAVWGAHKIRNRIAHESDYQPSYQETMHALKSFKQALKDLGAI